MKAKLIKAAKVLGWIFVCFIAVAIVILWISRVPPPDLTITIFGNEEVRSTFANADKVTVQRLRLHEGLISPRDLKNYDHGPEQPVPAATAREIQRLFQQRESFEWNSVSSCAPEYGVLFTFRSSGRSVQLVLCFGCGQFSIHDDNSSVNSIELFGPIWTELVVLVKPLFPSDKEIAALDTGNQ